MLSTRTREIRESKGITLRHLAKTTGIPVPNLSRIERGMANFTIETLHRIASALDVEPATLLQTSNLEHPTKAEAVQ